MQDLLIVLLGLLAFGFRIYRLFRLGRFVTRSVASRSGLKGATADGTTLCPYCHQRILARDYPTHAAQHAQRMPDGQQKDHTTVAPPQRYAGSLEGVPRVYYHPVCKTSTQMPEEVIRTYLVNPFFYNGTTFCIGCHNYVPMEQVFWTETRENVGQYMGRLQAQARGAQPPVSA